MNKIRTISSAIKNNDSKIMILWIIKTILGIPAIIIHELSHILIILISIRNFKFGKWEFLSGEIDNNIVIGLKYNFPIIISEIDNKFNAFINILVAIAPIFGIFGYFIFNIMLITWLDNKILALIIWYLSIIYFFVMFDLFWLSDDDKNTLKCSYIKVIYG